MFRLRPLTHRCISTSKISQIVMSSIPNRSISRNFASSATALPAWLESLLSTRAPGPKLFRWTQKGIMRGREDDLRDSSDPERIHILGVGNLGRLFAMSLANLPKPPPITLVVHRKELLELWEASPGISITRDGKTKHNANFDIEMWSEEAPPAGPVQEVAKPGSTIRNLIVATKAGAALPETDRLGRYLGASSDVMFVQNGMNKLWPPYGQLYNEARYPEGQHPSWMTCVVTHGVTSEGPFRSIHASPADAVLGPVGSSSAMRSLLVRHILAAPELAARAVPRAELWLRQLEKLVVNSTINPLTAILRCKNGALVDEDTHPDVGRLIDLLLREASDVLTCLVSHESKRDDIFSTADGNSTSSDAAAQAMQRVSYPALSSMFSLVADKVRANTSSMLQDVQAGKSTEVRGFNGWIIDTAAFLDAGLDVSTHKALMRLVEDNAVVEQSQFSSHFSRLRQDTS